MHDERAQSTGVTGFLARNGGKFEFADVTIESKNEYATVNVVSLDYQPISDCSKLLVQAVTVNRLTGYQTKDATFSMGQDQGAYKIQGEQIVRIGNPPFRIVNTEVTVSFRNSQLNTATVLDINGYPVKTQTISNQKFELPKNCFYVVLHAAKN